MTDETTENPDEPGTFQAGHDPMLQIIVGMAETDVTTGVTVFLPGYVAEGKTLSSKEYFKQFISQIAEGIANGAETARRRGETELAEGMERGRAAMVERLKVDSAGSDEAGESRDLKTVRSFLHLKEATVSAGGVNHEVPLLRIDVTKIAAWTLGTSS